MSMNMDHKKNNHKDEVKEEPKEGAQAKSVTIPEAEYLKLKEDAAKVQEYWDRVLRMQADFENMRKRQEKERQDFTRYANEGIIVELLVVLDDLQRTVDLAETKHQDLSAFLKGVEMILAHLYEMLKNHGIKPINAKGALFDPNCHEALMQAEDNSVPEHTVLEELQKGYKLNDRVIRTAKVKVSKKTGTQLQDKECLQAGDNSDKQPKEKEGQDKA